jgi:putative thioredoxin
MHHFHANMKPQTLTEPMSAALVKDSDTHTFMQDVIETSQTVPVIVDLWAPWCGPCKQLGPVLEKAVTALGGKVRMVKVNVDENPQLAQSLRVQSIPAVFAFFKGQPVDAFMGAVPESQLKAFVDRCAKLAGAAAGTDTASMLKQAAGFMAEGKADHAAALCEDILKTEPENAVAYIGLVRAVLAMGGQDEAKHLFDEAPEVVRKDPNWEALEKAFALVEKVANAPPSADLKLKVDAEPANHQVRYDYAMSLYGEGQKEAAVDQLLEIVKRDRKWNEEAARKELVSIFETLGPMDPLTIESRKKLSVILFS